MSAEHGGKTLNVGLQCQRSIRGKPTTLLVIYIFACKTADKLVATSKKIWNYLGVFPKCLDHKKHFWFSQKFSLFVSIPKYTFGNRGPPFKENFPNNPVSAVFSKIKRPRP